MSRCCHCQANDIFQQVYFDSNITTANIAEYAWPLTVDYPVGWPALGTAIDINTDVFEPGRDRGVERFQLTATTYRNAWDEDFVPKLLSNNGTKPILFIGHLNRQSRNQSGFSFTENSAMGASPDPADVVDALAMKQMGRGCWPKAGTNSFEQVMHCLRAGYDVICYVPIIKMHMSGETDFGSPAQTLRYDAFVRQSVYERINQFFIDIGSGSRVQTLSINDWGSYQRIESKAIDRTGFGQDIAPSEVFYNDWPTRWQLTAKYADDNSLLSTYLDERPLSEVINEIETAPRFLAADVTEAGTNLGASTNAEYLIDTLILCNNDPSTHMGYHRWARAWFDTFSDDVSPDRSSANTHWDTVERQDEMDTWAAGGAGRVAYYSLNRARYRQLRETRKGISVGPLQGDCRKYDLTDQRVSPFATIESLHGGRLVICPCAYPSVRPMQSSIPHSVILDRLTRRNRSHSFTSIGEGNNRNSGNDLYPTSSYQTGRTNMLDITNGGIQASPNVTTAAQKLVANAAQVTATWEPTPIYTDEVQGLNVWMHRVKSGTNEWNGTGYWYNFSFDIAADPADGSVPDDLEYQMVVKSLQVGPSQQILPTAGTSTRYTIFFETAEVGDRSLPEFATLISRDAPAANAAFNRVSVLLNSRLDTKVYEDAVFTVDNPWQRQTLQSVASPFNREFAHMVLLRDDGDPALDGKVNSNGFLALDNADFNWIGDYLVAGTSTLECYQDGVWFRSTEWYDDDMFQPNSANNNSPRDKTYGSSAKVSTFKSDAGALLDWSDTAPGIVVVMKTVVRGSDLQWGATYKQMAQANAEIFLQLPNEPVNLTSYYAYDRNQDWVLACGQSDYPNVLTMTVTPVVGLFEEGEDVQLTFEVTNNGDTTVTAIDVVSVPAMTVDGSTIASLAPAASASIVSTYTLTAADEAAGEIDFVSYPTGTYKGLSIRGADVDTNVVGGGGGPPGP